MNSRACPARAGRSAPFSPPSRVYGLSAASVSGLIQVGEDEQPFSPVRSSHGCGFKQERSRHDVPEPSQISGNLGQTKYDMAGDVLEKAQPGPALRDDAGDVGPEMPGVARPAPLAGDAEGLARVARSDAIHDSTPRASVKGSQVRPDRSLIQPPFFHAADKRCCRKGFPLAVSHTPGGRDGDSEPEVEPPDPGAEGQHVEGTYSHTTGLRYRLAITPAVSTRETRTAAPPAPTAGLCLQSGFAYKVGFAYKPQTLPINPRP